MFGDPGRFEYDVDDFRQCAAVIDAETGLPELIASLRDVLPALEEMAKGPGTAPVIYSCRYSDRHIQLTQEHVAKARAALSRYES